MDGRNGMDSSAVPQGFAMMQLPFDGSVPVSPLDVPCTGPAPMLALASALASASPENQRLVMLDEQGLSKGSGFVAFSFPEEATKALHEMNGKMIGWKPLYVVVAQQKEQWKARLQAHFAQIRAPGAITPPASGILGFHHDGLRLPQKLYFGQGSPSIIPTQPAGFGFQQQLLPEMRPGVAPNFIMLPLQRQG